MLRCTLASASYTHLVNVFSLPDKVRDAPVVTLTEVFRLVGTETFVHAYWEPVVYDP